MPLVNNVKFSNFFKTILSLGVSDTDTVLTVPDTSGSPGISGAQYFYLVLESVDRSKKEVVKCTAKTSTTFTVVRAQEGTSAQAFSSLDRCRHSLTAGSLDDRFTEQEVYLSAGIDGLTTRMDALDARIAVGEIIFFPHDVVPVGGLECSGAAISRTDYAALFSKIGVRFGAGDGSSTFNLPDIRGRFIRVWDHGAGHDPGASARTDRGDGTTGDAVGTIQKDGLKKHVHPLGANTGKAGGWESVIDPGSWAGHQHLYSMDMLRTDLEIISDLGSLDEVARGEETTVRNISLMAVIRYA